MGRGGRGGARVQPLREQVSRHLQQQQQHRVTTESTGAASRHRRAQRGSNDTRPPAQGKQFISCLGRRKKRNEESTGVKVDQKPTSCVEEL